MKSSAPALVVSLVTFFIAMARADVSPPAAVPVLTFPANGAPSVALDPAGGFTLDWENVAAADSYQVQLATPPMDFILPTVDDLGDTTSKYVNNLAKGTVYKWRVRAQNAGGLGPWSAEYSFTTQPLNTPSLLLPSPGASNVAPKPSITFSWGDSNPPLPSVGLPTIPPMPGMGYTYRLQVSTDPGFPSVPPPPMPGLPPSPPYIIDLTFSEPAGGGVHDTTVSGFTFGRTYFWRVKTTLGSATSAWSEIRSFTTLQPPPTITLLNPAPGAVDVPVSPVLKWTDTNRPFVPPMIGIPGAPMPAPYWVRVATDSTFPDIMPMPPIMPIPPAPPYLINELVPDTTLTLTQSLIRGRKYYWRVMVQESSGGNGSYASGSFTVLPDPPGFPLLVTPGPEAVDVPLAGPLTWAAEARATGYRIHIGADSTFSDPAKYKEATTSATSLTVNLAVSTRYFWRARAENAGGNSGYSPAHAFTTVPPPPAAPVLVYPRQDSVIPLPQAILNWANTIGQTYHVQLASDPDFADLVASDSGLSDTYIFIQWATPFLTQGSSYYWRVRGKNAGGAGVWSNTFRFSVLPPVPRLPFIQSPYPGAPNISLSPTLAWGASPFASTYTLQVATDSNFSSPVISRTGMSDTTAVVGPLSRSQTYYWRVSASNAAGTSDWAGPLPFTTIPEAPGKPNLVAPADGAVNRPYIGLVLQITGQPGSEMYDFQVAVDSGFASKVVDDSLFWLPDHPVMILATGTRFWWRARARNAGGPGPWSDVRTFTTVPEVPVQPKLLSPDSIALDLPLNVTLVCSSVPGADRYSFTLLKLVRQGDDFSFVTVDSFTGTDTTRQLGLLENGATYFWTVSAENAGGQSFPGIGRSFTTVPTLPSAVSLVYPDKGDTLTGDSLTGRWHSGGPLVFRYRVQVSRDSAFTSPVTDSMILDTVKVIRYAAGNGRYWWRVQACNTVGWGPYSEARWFLVDNPASSLAGSLRLAPGPGGRSTLVRFTLADASRVTVSLFDLHGRERARPLDGWQSAGSHTVDFEAVDSQGRRMTRGWYLLRLEARSAAASKAMGRSILREEAPILPRSLIPTVSAGAMFEAGEFFGFKQTYFEYNRPGPRIPMRT